MTTEQQAAAPGPDLVKAFTERHANLVALTARLKELADDPAWSPVLRIEAKDAAHFGNLDCGWPVGDDMLEAALIRRINKRRDEQDGQLGEPTTRESLERWAASRPAPTIVDQPPPVPNDRPAIADLVVADMVDRKALGIERYGVALQPGNGRDALVDAYQEALDLCMYLRQMIEERT